MYSQGVAATPGAIGGAKGAIAGIASFVCIFIVVILLGGTIVLALIPIYTSNRSVPSDSAASLLQSKEVTMEMEIGKSPPTTRRRRQTEDLGDYDGLQFGPSGKEMARKTLRSVLPSSTVGDVSVSSATIGFKADGTKKRFALLKRAVIQRTVILIFRFYIIYVPSCLLSCQTAKGPILRTTLFAAPVSIFSFTQVTMYKNGVPFKTLSRIQVTTIFAISVIIPGKSPITLAPTTTAATTTTAVTATTTAPSATPATG